MSKWLQEKQMTAFEVTYQGKTKTCRTGPGRIPARPGALWADERINFRDVVNIISGLALGQRFVDLAGIPYLLRCWSPRPTAKQLVGNALRGWPVATAPRMPCLCSMRWNCSMATASIRQLPATRRKCSTG